MLLALTFFTSECRAKSELRRSWDHHVRCCTQHVLHTWSPSDCRSRKWGSSHRHRGSFSWNLGSHQAIIISDLVSLADRGLYQGGVNVLFGAGAAIGTVIGGVVADTWGWRWAFLIQLPAIAGASVLVITQVHIEAEKKGPLSPWEKFKRIDWAGSVVLMISVGPPPPRGVIKLRYRSVLCPWLRP